MNQAKINNLVSQLHFKIRSKRRNLSTPEGLQGRARKISRTLTALLKYERIELAWARADETRGYVERLISEAIRHGPTHAETMAMADYWIIEKQYVHKLFKVLVPRFKDYTSSSFTKIHHIQTDYPGSQIPKAVLELKGNPYPSLEYPRKYENQLIHNVLLDAARKEYRLQKYKELSMSLKQDQ
ncbi:39S ribosomal protein L17, mitochondrial [Chelonus insularis]|uniref:39S ribosomal protein L17, mitochondrial n=1 Tax=Chelonus insularis TaxID=460826 RepID=UPI00158B45B4|nr:39S ribosomal protein L17, mitochondrial [Chelonus insularis]